MFVVYLSDCIDLVNVSKVNRGSVKYVEFGIPVVVFIPPNA